MSNKCIYELIEEEVKRQQDLWGEQNHPDVPELNGWDWEAKAYSWKQENALRNTTGKLAWDGNLLEEVYEALAESDPEKLKTELVQVAAVAVTWIKCIERRKK